MKIDCNPTFDYSFVLYNSYASLKIHVVFILPDELVKLGFQKEYLKTYSPRMNFRYRHDNPKSKEEYVREKIKIFYEDFISEPKFSKWLNTIRLYFIDDTIEYSLKYIIKNANDNYATEMRNLIYSREGFRSVAELNKDDQVLQDYAKRDQNLMEMYEALHEVTEKIRKQRNDLHKRNSYANWCFR